MDRDTELFINDKRIIIIMIISTLLLFSTSILRNIVIMPKFDTNTLNNFYTIFISIILEGFPFIIIGSLVSSLIQVFISEETIVRIVPRNKFLGLVFAGIIGLVFPVCDCAIIPVTRRLIKKGVPIGMAITFMLSVPIVNPMVLISTYYAFTGKQYVLFARLIFGVIGAMIIGCLIDLLHTGKVLKYDVEMNSCTCHEHHDHNHDHHEHKTYFLSDIIHHTSSETYDIGKLFIIGALISSFVQTYVPKKYILSIGQGNIYSILIMFILSYILCICSQTDAFIARTFLGQFTIGSVIGFLVFGPMLDMKNTLMLVGTFSRKFTITLIILIISVCFLMAVSANYIVPISLKLLGGVQK